MGFLDLFRQKKEVQAKPAPSIKPIPPTQSFKPQMPKYNMPKPKPLDLTPTSKPQIAKPEIPAELPSFPIDTERIKESEQELPRFEKDSTVKDFISSQPSKPFIHKLPREFEPLPSFEEKPFETKPMFRREIKSMDKPARFDLHEEVRKPLFIKTNQYRDAKSSVSSMRNKLNEADEISYRMDNLKEDQDSQFELFHKKIEDIQRKLIYIDKTIFEKGD